ncbi:MAG: DUF192 domain-containing protein [Thiobacillaceae bacterium]
MNDREGMLFVFPGPRKVCMWMKNTFIPLSVAFIRQDGIIAGLDDMEPMTRRTHCSPEPVKYALEVPRGWFGSHAVALGGEITGLPQQAR